MLDVASWPKGMRHNRSPSRSLASKPSRPADQPKTIQRRGKDTAGHWNPPARHGSRAQTLTTVSKRPQGRRSQASQPGSRKMQASVIKVGS